MEINRRTFLGRAGLLAGAAALPSTMTGRASAVPADPDTLFRAGEFTRADRGYEQLLRRDPGNAWAVGQRGYIALLSNRFGDATKYLTKAVRLAPDDVVSKQRLAESYVRQDQHAYAVPLLQSTGRPRDEAYAKLYDALRGKPWQVRGAQHTRVPMLEVDPVPHVEASVNGGKPQRFLLDTYATLDLAADVAARAGLRAVASTSGVVSGKPITIYLGIMASFRIGDLELRNLPVQWIDTQRPPLPDGSQPAGVIGTTVFYHLLTTMNYRDRSLVLRRKGTADPRRHHDHLPLWLAGDHYPCTLGSLGSVGPRLVTVDTGGIGHGLDTTVEIAERAGIAVDYAHPIDFGGSTLYPITPDRISLGRAVGHHINGLAAKTVPSASQAPASRPSSAST
ncbi:aspartyl protease family protein [Kribbella sp. DT2]|uniref:aspartyl protease family protein n=1 Tax=Kribbella sp. DT2 TaxID=3393427 RepID=UPI003CF02BFB